MTTGADTERPLAPLAVAVPTRDRPDKLRGCLAALDRARRTLRYPVFVGDSSTREECRREVEEICARYDYIELTRYTSNGFPQSRNNINRFARGELILCVVDDVYVEEDAIERMLDAYRAASGWRVVAGAVSWDDAVMGPVVMRRIGWGRPAREGEEPSFLVGALLLYPRALALACPWPEAVPVGDDRVIGPLWRAKGVRMIFARDARARHDDVHTVYGVESQRDHIYTNLLEALVVERSLALAAGYEVLGFLAAAKLYVRGPRSALALVRAWFAGHRLLARDWRPLKEAVAAPLPSPPAAGAPMDGAGQVARG